MSRNLLNGFQLDANRFRLLAIGVGVWCCVIALDPDRLSHAAQKKKSTSNSRPLPLQRIEKPADKKKASTQQKPAPGRRRQPAVVPPKVDTETLEDFMAKKEKALQTIRADMLSSIEVARTKIEESKVAPELKEKRLVHVDSDLKGCLAGNDLPTCDELLEVTVNCLEARYKLLGEIQKKRKSLVDDPTTDAEKEERGKLKKLEGRVERLLGGPPLKLQKGSWGGRGITTDDETLAWGFKIQKLEADHFTGVMRQKKDTAGMVGSQSGHAVKINTVGTAIGLNQSFELNGYRIGDRYLGRITGLQLNGKQLSGWFVLAKTRDDSR